MQFVTGGRWCRPGWGCAESVDDNGKRFYIQLCVKYALWGRAARKCITLHWTLCVCTCVCVCVFSGEQRMTSGLCNVGCHERNMFVVKVCQQLPKPRAQLGTFTRRYGSKIRQTRGWRTRQKQASSSLMTVRGKEETPDPIPDRSRGKAQCHGGIRHCIPVNTYMAFCLLTLPQ